MADLSVRFTIDWYSGSNDDIADEGETLPPDEGWYVGLDGHGTIGRDYFGPGYGSLDEALAVVEKWATDRGLTINKGDVVIHGRAARIGGPDGR